MRKILTLGVNLLFLFISTETVHSETYVNRDVLETQREEFSNEVVSDNKQDSAHGRILVGVVKDDMGQPLQGAVVYIKSDRTHGTQVDQHGNFVLKDIPKGNHTLVFYMMGMKKVEIKYTGQESTVVILKEDTESIKNAIVTGIVTRYKDSFTGSATTMTGKELKKINSGGIMKGIEALEPAVRITENSLRGADPNTLPDMEIRGKTSIVGEISSEYENIPNEPLFILDGMETNLETIVNLNIDRVKSVTILKDAASTAIYGSKAANGVIVVETIPPESGELRVSYAANFTLQFPNLRDYNLMNASEKLEYERLAGRYTSRSEAEDPQQDKLDELYYKRLKDVRSGVDSYWLSDPLRSVLNHSHNLYLDGGDNHMQYGIGLNFGDDKGVMKGSDRSVTGGNIQIRYRKGHFTFTNNFNANFVSANHEPVPFYTFAQANPYYKKRNEDGFIPLLLEDMSVANTAIYNPLALFNIKNENKSESQSYSNQVNLTWRFLGAFSLRGTMGIIKNISESETFKSPSHPDFKGSLGDKKGLFTNDRSDHLSYNGRVVFSFGKLIAGIHNISANASWDFSNRDYKTQGYAITGFVGDQHTNPAFSAGFDKGTKPMYRKSTTRSTGFLLSTNYSYKGKYIMDLNYRIDGSSVFGAQKRFTGTWSVGLAYDISNEDWFDVEWINHMKFRYSAGNPGNQNFDAYMSSGIYKYNSAYTNIFGESAIIDKIANKNLKWQKTLDNNFGLDFSFFEDRLKFSADYYYKNTDPLLVSVTLPPSTGVSRKYTNLGSQISQGYSGSLNILAIKKDDLRLNFNFSFRHNESKYENIGNSLEFMNQKDVFRRYYDGASPDDIWTVRSKGIDPATGREVFIDKQGNYTFKYNAEDEVKVGSSAPDLEGFLGVSLFWKQFSANLN